MKCTPKRGHALNKRVSPNTCEDMKVLGPNHWFYGWGLEPGDSYDACAQEYDTGFVPQIWGVKHAVFDVVLKDDPTMLRVWRFLKVGKSIGPSDPSVDESDDRWDAVRVGESEEASVEYSRDKVEGIHVVVSKVERIQNIIDTKPFYSTNVDALLGFNEPDNEDEAHLTPLEAAEIWPAVEQKAAELGIPRIGSPAATTVSFNGNFDIPGIGAGNRALKWYEEFFTACKTCKIDFLVVHMYNQNVNTAKYILTELHRIYQLPIWVKEFNNGGRWANGGEGLPVEKHLEYMEDLVSWMEQQPFIERYAWMSARNNLFSRTSLIEPDITPPQLTELGNKYRDLPMNVGK